MNIRSSAGRIWRDPFGRMGIVILVVVLGFAAIVPFLADADATRVNPPRKLRSPAWWSDQAGTPLFGTDHLGRDLGVLTAEGIRLSLLIGLSAVAVSALIGWMFGSFTGFMGGRFDDVGGRMMDLSSAFPGLLLVIALITVLGSSLLNLVLILAAVTWDIFARIARAATLQLRSAGYVEAARVGRVGLGRTMWVHVRKNTAGVVIALVAIEIPRLVLAEATLSFLGFGLSADQVSLGSLIAAERDSLQLNAWAVALPGIALSLLCVGLALVGLAFRGSMLLTRAELEVAA